jgi:hypothetical protein
MIQPMNPQRLIPLLLLLCLSAGCLSHRAVSERRALVEAARSDAESARSEFLALAKQDLQTQGALALRDIEDQFGRAVSEQHAAGNATPEKIASWSKMYARERDAIRSELNRRAAGLTAILRKIESGGKAVAALERMQVNAEDARRQFLLGYEAPAIDPQGMPENLIAPELAALIDELMTIKIEKPKADQLPDAGNMVGPPAPEATP